MEERQNVKILMELGYNFEEILEIQGFRFGLESTFRYNISPENAARMHKIFGNDYSVAGIVYGFINEYYKRMDYKKNGKVISSDIIVGELEENLDFWREEMLKNFKDIMEDERKVE